MSLATRLQKLETLLVAGNADSTDEGGRYSIHQLPFDTRVLILEVLRRVKAEGRLPAGTLTLAQLAPDLGEELTARISKELLALENAGPVADER